MCTISINLHVISVGGPCSSRARYPCRSGPPVGSEDVLQFPRPHEPVPDNGVSARRRHDDAAHEEGYSQ